MHISYTASQRILLQLAASLLFFTLQTGTTHAEETCDNLPDIAGWTYLGSYFDDREADVPGKETEISGFQKDNIQLIFATYKGQERPWGYWHVKVATGKTFYTYVDTDNDCIYETRIPVGTASITMDLQAWGF